MKGNVLKQRNPKVGEEARNANISKIGFSGNVVTFKSTCRQMESKGVAFNVPKGWAENIARDAMKTARDLLATETYLPFIADKEIDAITYMTKIIEGKSDIEKIEETLKREKEQEEELVSKIEKYADKGNYARLEKYQIELEQLRYPDKFAALAGARLKELKEQGVSEQDDNYVALSRLHKQFQRKAKAKNTTTEALEFRKEHERALRLFISEHFFHLNTSTSKCLDRFLRDYYGEVIVDFEHVLLLYNYMENTNHKDLDKVRGLLYYLAAEAFYIEVTELKKAVKNNRLYPSFDMGAETFGWKRFPQFYKRYMMHLTKPEGYKCYSVELDNISQVAYITSQETLEFDTNILGNRLSKAIEFVRNRETGLFFNFLSKTKENILIPYLLTEAFPMWRMDGDCKDDLWADFLLRNNKFDGQEDLCNMYNRLVKPYSLDITGNLLSTVLEKLENLADKDAAFVYYLSPQRIGVAVREDIQTADIFQGFEKMMKPIAVPNVRDIAYGMFL